MNSVDTKAAILVSNHFEQSEFTEPLERLKDAGVKVTVISSETLDMQALEHATPNDIFKADMLLRDANFDDYDALVLPGGALNADHLRMDPKAQSWVQDFLEAGKPVAAICHAPWLLVSADVLDGKHLTSYHTIQDDIRNAGGDWVDEPAVIDDNLLTSRKPDDLPIFCEKLLDMLREYSENEGLTAADESSGGSDTEPSEVSIEQEARLHSLGYDSKRDQLSKEDQHEILADEDFSDPDEIHPSGTTPMETQDHTQ